MNEQHEQVPFRTPFLRYNRVDDKKWFTEAPAPGACLEQQDNIKLRRAMEESLRRVDEATEDMLCQCASLSLRLDLVDQITLPIRERSSALTKAQSNITTTLSKLERISSHFQVANEVESLVVAEDDCDQAANTEDLLHAINRISDSIGFLSERKSFLSTDAYVKRLKSLQDSARDRCLRGFEQLLLSRLTESTTRRAAAVCQRLLATNDRRPLDSYGATRGKVMMEHLAAATDISSSAESPVGAATTGTPTAAVASSSPFLLPSIPYVAGEHSFLATTRVVVALLRAEVEFFRKLMPQDRMGVGAFEAACMPIVEEV